MQWLSSVVNVFAALMLLCMAFLANGGATLAEGRTPADLTTDSVHAGYTNSIAQAVAVTSAALGRAGDTAALDLTGLVCNGLLCTDDRAGLTPAATAGTEPIRLEGTISGANYTILVPTQWNGILLLYNHGYRDDNDPKIAELFADLDTGIWLFNHGYALAGSSFRDTGWAIDQAVEDDIALLDLFEQQIGHPRHVISWGYSMGGIVTALLAQRYPGRISGALPVCGPLGGMLGHWNSGLDILFVLKTLVLPNAPLEIVDIKDPGAAHTVARTIIVTAQQTAQGRARLALAANVGGVPGWFAPDETNRPPQDVATQEVNQFFWLVYFTSYMFTQDRYGFEQGVGGNPSWNTGVDYGAQLARSPGYPAVQQLYKQAGLSLNADLRTLALAPRIAPDLDAVVNASHQGIFDGQLAVPVLTLHNVADGIFPAEHERAYASVVQAAGKQALLRQLFVQRPGHCLLTSAEMVTAMQVLVHRVETGSWKDTDNSVELNAQAASLGPSLNTAPVVHTPYAPAFGGFTPAMLLRAFDLRKP